MTPEEIQDMIDNCRRMIADCQRWIALCEREIERGPGMNLPDGRVAHPVGDTSGPSTLKTNASGLCHLDPLGTLADWVDT